MMKLINVRLDAEDPDFADAWLAVLSGMDAKIQIWTYDKGFAKIWRRPDGTLIPLAVET